MSFLIHGTGVTCYGQCDFRPDGSHVTTEWMVLGYVPLWPVRSMRVKVTPRHFLSWRPRELVVLADGPVSWGQALRAWAYVLSLPLALLAGGATGWHPWLQMLPVTLAAVAPWPWRWWCRRR